MAKQTTLQQIARYQGAAEFDDGHGVGRELARQSPRPHCGYGASAPPAAPRLRLSDHRVETGRRDQWDHEGRHPRSQTLDGSTADIVERPVAPEESGVEPGDHQRNARNAQRNVSGGCRRGRDDSQPCEAARHEPAEGEGPPEAADGDSRTGADPAADPGGTKSCTVLRPDGVHGDFHRDASGRTVRSAMEGRSGPRKRQNEAVPSGVRAARSRDERRDPDHYVRDAIPEKQRPRFCSKNTDSCAARRGAASVEVGLAVFDGQRLRVCQRSRVAARHGRCLFGRRGVCFYWRCQPWTSRWAECQNMSGRVELFGLRSSITSARTRSPVPALPVRALAATCICPSMSRHVVVCRDNGVPSEGVDRMSVRRTLCFGIERTTGQIRGDPQSEAPPGSLPVTRPSEGLT
jgi:hypothetical protein